MYLPFCYDVTKKDKKGTLLTLHLFYDTIAINQIYLGGYMAEYKLIGSFAADRASVRRAMNDNSLTQEQKQALIDQHNKMNLDSLTLPNESHGYCFDKYVLPANFSISTNSRLYSFGPSLESQIISCDAQLFTLKRKNKELFDQIDPLVYSKNPFGAKKRAEKLAQIPADVMEQYNELDTLRRKLTEKLAALKNEQKELMKD